VQQECCCADIVFAGGADKDRLPLVTALIREQFDVALYGGYWDRYLVTRRFALGHADPATLRKAVAGAKVSLCLVRRANRDGSAMRTFEFAAMGGCMLAEYTEEHREILGEDGEAVVYFRSSEEMIARLRWLLSHHSERSRLAGAVRTRITNGRNTYKDRLETMLATTATASES
jgi:spore maturation protein CgeB